MKNKRIIVSVAIIAILLLYLVLSNTTSKNDKIPEIKKLDKIDEMVITKDNITINLHKKDNDWFINDKFEADAVKVNNLETGMKKLEIIEYISKGHYTRYDLTPEKAIHVILKDKGKIQRDVMIGKASSTNRSAYIKISDDDGIYLASSNLNSDYTTTVDELREKEIHKFKSDDLSWLQLSYKGKTFTFEKKTEEVKEDKDNNKKAENEKQNEKKTEDNWYCKELGNIKIIRNKLNPLLSAFSTLRAEKYPEIEKKNLKGLICIVKGKIPGKEVTLIIHKKYEKEEYICSSSESQYSFILQDWAAKGFFKETKDFK